ncbi:MAG: iron-only hydrogenase system regulator [Solobacterium sp.]|nr:iron-only hydrogenase system regulator [Solobacterium sp.]
MEETRIAVIAVIVEDGTKVSMMNEILHEYADSIIGRMGIPYRAKNLSLISVAVDAPLDTINALTGKLGKIEGISVKTALSKA